MPETEREGKVPYFICPICKIRYPTPEEAKECESKGLDQNSPNYEESEEVIVKWPTDKNTYQAKILWRYIEPRTHKIMWRCYIPLLNMHPIIAADKIVKLE